MRELVGDAATVALVAVGGYGRRELCPNSDLDLVLLHRGRRDIKTVAERIWYPIWDAGIGLDHSVRTPRDVSSVAADDLRAALGLLDLRFVAGDASLANPVAAQMRELWHRGSANRLDALRDAVERRHAEHGDVAFLLEPDVKEGRGGLRDAALFQALRIADPALPDPPPSVVDAVDELLRVRVALHRSAGRALDRLLLQEQDAIAVDLNRVDADQLMSSVAAAGRAISWWSDEMWRRAIRDGRGQRRSAAQELPGGLLLRDGEIDLGLTADRDDAALSLVVAEAAARHAAAISPAALEELAAMTSALGDRWSDRARHALVALLDAGQSAIPVIETLDQAGLMVRILPEWHAVRSKPQRNAYHRFTVDRHLCETAANAAGLTRTVGRPDLLLVGALLHDIGKGFPGDHTEVGIDLVDVIGTRMGFPSADVEVLKSLVRHHLLLADVATRRDLDDPATAESVAAAVADREVLDLLAALTEADSQATGPSAWGSWKQGLVRDLVQRVAARLDGVVPSTAGAFPDDEQRALLERGEQAVITGPPVVVVAIDRPGLFSRVAGTLALHGLDVRSAQAATGDNGFAIEVFDVEAGPAGWPQPDRLERDLQRAVAGRLALEARLADRARAYAVPGGRTGAARPTEARVLVHQDASASATVLEVRAPDAIGVLYRITRALSDLAVDVKRAIVSTLGHEVVDAFYVVDDRGGKVDDPDHVADVEKAVLAALRHEVADVRPSTAR